MVIGVLQIAISIPHARSLKDKRAVIRSVKDRAVATMNVSAAETGKQDLWQSAEMAFVTVAATRDIAESRMASLQQKLQSYSDYVLLDMMQEYL